MEFRILGPLEAIGDRGSMDLGGTRQQVVLAALLLSANRVVSMDRLVDTVYGDCPPATARSQVQIAISALRRLLADSGSGSIIETHPQGYITRVAGEQLDSLRFAELMAAARAARDGGQPAQAVSRYREALRLWRGPALSGIDSDLVRLAAIHLDEQRITGNEDRITLELDLGRHHELVPELTELVEEFPLRERLRGQLMLALYRCDRTADALTAYRHGRRVMIDELGIEPNERLQQLERAILTADPALDLASTLPKTQPARQFVPRLLPADIADFTGRGKQVEEIHEHLLTALDDEAQLAVPIAAISGKGGIGKTSIAVHAAHGITWRFPDGQLFANLHGASHPVSPMKVLDRFLHALGLAGTEVPETLEERAEIYRGLIAGRKVLVLLDDAANEAQVSPLLPGTPTAAVIVTSRERLAGLAGAVHVDVDVFDADKSVELLTRIAGTERVAAQSQAAAEIARLCGNLPLALRIAGARLSARQHWSIQQLVDRLSDEARRLDELRYGDMEIRASISLSYEGVSEQARCLFRRLAILDLPAFSDWVAAALLDQSFGDAQNLLDELVSARLIETASAGQGVQYCFHDLIRLFARERLAVEEPAAHRTAALERVLGALLDLAEEAHRRQYGGDYVRVGITAPRWRLPDWLVKRLVTDPMSWYERERAALLSGVRQAADAGLAELSWGLAISAVTLYESRFYLDDWHETHEVALEAARKTRDPRGQAAMLYSAGTLRMVEQQFTLARQSFAEAARLFADIGDDHGEALVIRHIAFLDRISGHLDDATRHYERALLLFRACGDLVATAYVLHSLAEVKLERDELGTAEELLAEALRLSQEARSGRVEAQVLCRIGEAHLLADEAGLAADVFERALAKVRDASDPLGEAYALHGIGRARIRLKDPDLAQNALERALLLARSLGDRLVEARVLLGMAEMVLAREEPGRAAALAEEASGIFRACGTPLYETQAVTVLDRAWAAMDGEEAVTPATALREQSTTRAAK